MAWDGLYLGTAPPASVAHIQRGDGSPPTSLGGRPRGRPMTLVERQTPNYPYTEAHAPWCEDDVDFVVVHGDNDGGVSGGGSGGGTFGLSEIRAKNLTNRSHFVPPRIFLNSLPLVSNFEQIRGKQQFFMNIPNLQIFSFSPPCEMRIPL